MELKEEIKITVLPGDGIGIEVTQATIPIIDLLNVPCKLTFGDIGWEYWKKEGNPIPERTWNLITESHTVLLGAITSKPQREANEVLAPEFKKNPLHYVSPIIQLRQKLDLFANLRPCFSLHNEDTPFNFCIIRENTEGLYSGFDYAPPPDSILDEIKKNPRWHNVPAHELSCALRLQSKKGLLRLFEYAFQYAHSNKMNRVTFADKPNVLRQSGAFARDIFEQVAKQYPHIHADILNVDAVALWIVRRPEEFGVIVAENMFGDILSDLGAGIMGGLGFAPSANIGQEKSYFEPVHGSGPRMKPDSANPSAMFLSISLLLDYFGYAEAAQKIINAVTKTVNQGQWVTYDLGGKATTVEMANEIMEHCLKTDNYSSPAPLSLKKNKARSHQETQDLNRKEQLEKLQPYSTTEISDALDACGVEGALLKIKPLSSGMKMIGLAYTIKYLPYPQKTRSFKNAANYIDAVPAGAIIVIDNDGREDCTVWGDILTQVAIRNNISGTVVYGAVRDVTSIKASAYPVFSTSICMRSGKNRVYKSEEQYPLLINGVTINPGDIIFADSNGVLVIPQGLLPDIIGKAHNIQLTENNIKEAIKSGSTLEQARKKYGYDQPWLDQDKK